MTRARENADGARLDAPLLSPALVTPNLGTPSAGVMTNVTGMPLAGLSATGTASATTYLRGDNSWQTAGSTSASDLASGTLAVARMATGTVIQTAFNSYTTQTTIGDVTGGTWGDSGLTGAITPTSTSNKLLILVGLHFQGANPISFKIGIHDGTSTIYDDGSTNARYYEAGTNNFRNIVNVFTYITPSASGSEITYNVQISKDSNHTMTCQHQSVPSSIIIQEITG